MDWLPDLRVGTFEVRDFANVVITGLGAYLALLAIRMGRRQEAIAKRQAEIAEVQYQIMQEQLAKAATLRVRADTAQEHHPPETVIPIEVFNDGNKTARGFFWELLRSDALAQNVRLVDVGFGAVASSWEREAVAEAKLELQTDVAWHLGWPDLTGDTKPEEPTFNVWIFHDPALCAHTVIGVTTLSTGTNRTWRTKNREQRTPNRT